MHDNPPNAYQGRSCCRRPACRQCDSLQGYELCQRAGIFSVSALRPSSE